MNSIEPLQPPQLGAAPSLPKPGTQSQQEKPDPQDNTARWFLDGRVDEPGSKISVPITRGNQVTPYINYRNYYAAVAAAILATKGPDHFIYFCDWGYSPDTWMDTPDGRRTMRTLLEDASKKRGVAIRAMFYQGQMLNDPVHNGPHVEWINSLPTGGAVADTRYLDFGSHHQKMLVSFGEKGLLGFCGGMDIAEDRQLRDGGQSPPLKDTPAPWHDVQVQLEGPAAHHLWRTFNARWIDHPLSSLITHAQLQDPPLQIPPGKGTLDVQVVRTYGNGSRHRGLAVFGAAPTYAFAPNGEMTIYKLLVKAIKETRSTIYLEDQYLIESERMGQNPSLGEVLASTIAKSSFKHMVILVPGAGGPQQELHQVWRRRVRFWQQLGAQAEQKVLIRAYKADPESPYLVHAKTWIFDDTFAVISSANSNRRSYSHDSEVGVGVGDPNSRSQKLNFGHELRIALWLKHLNKKVQRVERPDVLDFEKAIKYWAPDPKSILDVIDLVHPTYIPPDTHLTSSLPASFSELQLFDGFLDYDQEWNLILDPDGS